ncbi:energy transducer TonB [Paraburkholderia sprentiae]|uniref:energy transducer TonB n=1 Tax=Paraburkholderia sprentiae TaxID=948107 RepID=UPI002ADE1BAB|nr:TonB family protein [Paraburkholderia sprentiae]
MQKRSDDACVHTSSGMDPVHGETTVEVRCSSSGNLESVRIVRSSSDANWDKAAVAAVRQGEELSARRRPHGRLGAKSLIECLRKISISY